MQGYTYFFIFALKHRLLVLVRTASLRRFKRVHTIYVLNKNKKKFHSFCTENFNSVQFKNFCILHGHVSDYFGYLKHSSNWSIQVDSPH